MITASSNSKMSFDSIALKSHSVIKENLSSQVYYFLRERIIHDELKPGEIYSISAIAEKLEVSRTPVHDACKRLEFEGFLTILPKQGILVKPITVDLARESYEMRAAIETYMLRRSFHQITKRDIETLEEICERQKGHIERKNIPEYMDADIEFHSYLIHRSNNEQANSLMDTLYIRALQIGIQVTKNSNRLEGSYKEHLDVIKAIKNNDIEQAIKLIEANIMNGYISLTGSYKL